MSQRSVLTRGATGAVALAGALALTLPGTASAVDAAQAKPTVTASANGGKVTIHIEGPADTECFPVVISPIDALPLVAGGAYDPGSISEKTLGQPYTPVEGKPDTWTTAKLDDGIYAVLGACTGVETTVGYSFAFLPGSIFGTGSQALTLGSTLITMEGGMNLIMEMLPGLMAGMGGGGDEGAADPGAGDTGGTGDEGAEDSGGSPLDSLDLGSLTDLIGGASGDGAPAGDGAGTGGGE